MSSENIHDEFISLSQPKIRKFDGHDWFSTKFSRRNLPHWELKGSTYYITIRVHKDLYKPFLKKEIAVCMLQILLNNDRSHYDLQAFVIMPDHLHLILKPLFNITLSEIMKKLKGSSSYQINKLLNRQGTFWQKESFDHLIRNSAGLLEKLEYIKQNPVRAKLVIEAEKYPFSSFFAG